MQAVALQGVYTHGKLKFDTPPPMKNAKVMVIFLEETQEEESKMSTEEALKILDKYAGSIDREFDYEKEKDEYFNEKYGPFN